MVNREQLQVLVVEGNPLTREGILAVVNRVPCGCICRDAGDARAARGIYSQMNPDIVVLDIALRHGDGIELLREVRHFNPRCCAVVVSSLCNAAMVERAFQAGATAYISKIDEAIELSKALEAAIIGKTYLGKIVSDCLHTEVTSRLPNRTLKLLHSLSDREFHIFRRIGAKQGASAIAQELSISIKTLETHQRRIKEKLNLSSGIQLHHAAESWIATVSREGIYSHSQER